MKESCFEGVWKKQKLIKKTDVVSSYVCWWDGLTLLCSSLFKIGKAATFNFSNFESRFKCLVEVWIHFVAGKWKIQKQKQKLFSLLAVFSASELNQLTVCSTVSIDANIYKTAYSLLVVFKKCTMCVWLTAQARALNTTLCLIYQTQANF